MAYFSRLIALVALFFTSQAFAAYESGGTPKYAGFNVSTGSLDSVADTCLKMGQIQAGSSNTSGREKSYDGFIGGTHRWTCEYNAFGTWVSSEIGQQCPGDFYVQLSGKKGSCFKPVASCPAGQSLGSDGVCFQPPTCGPNQELDTVTNTCVCKTGPAGSFTVSGDVYLGCNNGCSIVLTSGSYSKEKNKTYGNWNQNGATCSPSGSSPEPDPSTSPDGQDAGKCPTGQCPGTFNGQFMCVPCKGKESSDSSSSETTTDTPSGASAPSGSTTGSTTGSKSTECDGGTCVTTEKVIVTNPDGSTTEKDKQTTETMSEFCAKNPKAAICKAADEGRWGGSCASGFQCSGDAVQCAQAEAAWKSACASDVSGMTEQINIGTAAMAAGAASGLGLPGGDSGFDLASRLSSAPLFGSSGSCPSDVTVSVSGQSYTMPFSSMCSNLRILGAALMAFAYLVAGFIVFRGDKS